MIFIQKLTAGILRRENLNCQVKGELGRFGFAQKRKNQCFCDKYTEFFLNKGENEKYRKFSFFVCKSSTVIGKTFNLAVDFVGG